MAGHAPEIVPFGRRLEQWLVDLSDFRISAYMLLAAGAIGVMLYLLDQRVFDR